MRFLVTSNVRVRACRLLQDEKERLKKKKRSVKVNRKGVVGWLVDGQGERDNLRINISFVLPSRKYEIHLSVHVHYLQG